jgi:hypothetical protein
MVNDPAAVWRTCRSIILAGWAALGCDVGATMGEIVGPRGQMSKVLWGPVWSEVGQAVGRVPSEATSTLYHSDRPPSACSNDERLTENSERAPPIPLGGATGGVAMKTTILAYVIEMIGVP